MRLVKKPGAYALVFLCLGGLVLASGCAMSKNESGRPIDDLKVQTIVDGKTTLNQIIATFGAPTSSSDMAGSTLYTYRHTITSGTGTAFIPGISSVNTTTQADELTITFDKATGIVTAHSLQRGIKA